MKSLLLAVALTAALAIPALAQVKPKAVIVITTGELRQCTFGNINVAWVIILQRADNVTRAGRRYITSEDITPELGHNCIVLPVDLPAGSQIRLSGILADRLAVNGLAPSVNEDCFNAEAYSVGLSSNPNQIGEQINPQDPTNIINTQGYGLFWDETDAQSQNLGQPAFTFTVVGCGPGVKCPLPKTIYNTDTGLINNPGCPVLAPLS
jgi:hypothetical protein